MTTIIIRDDVYSRHSISVSYHILLMCLFCNFVSLKNRVYSIKTLLSSNWNMVGREGEESVEKRDPNVVGRAWEGSEAELMLKLDCESARTPGHRKRVFSPFLSQPCSLSRHLLGRGFDSLLTPGSFFFFFFFYDFLS